jgi:hypothetical protein
MSTTVVSKLIVAVSLVVSPIAASAAAQPGADKSAAATADKKICKQLPSSTSRLPQRVCLTAQQWKQVEDANR